MNNLRRLLVNLDPSQPHYLGHTLYDDVKVLWERGGGGLLMQMYMFLSMCFLCVILFMKTGGYPLNVGACYVISRRTLQMIGKKFKTFEPKFMLQYGKLFRGFPFFYFVCLSLSGSFFPVSALCSVSFYLRWDPSASESLREKQEWHREEASFQRSSWNQRRGNVVCDTFICYLIILPPSFPSLPYI